MEPWLAGPIAGIDTWLQPAAHALIQSAADLRRAAEPLSPEQLWARPGGVASVAFHILHVTGATDRLLTYARGAVLDDAQRALLAVEAVKTPARAASELLLELDRCLERSLAQLRGTPVASLREARAVGRARLPSTVLGLIFHAAEHAQRHAGQALTTSKLLRA